MIQIHRTDEKPLDVNGGINIPAMMVPAFRNLRAKEAGVDANFLICTQGGLGDVVCAEPAIRYAVNNFKDVLISIDTYFPELFGHLKFSRMNDAKLKMLNYPDYIVFNTIEHRETLAWEFMAISFTHVVDHSTINMWRCQIPIAERTIKLVPSEKDFDKIAPILNPETDVLIHPGRTWQSRTIPSWFWSEVIGHLRHGGMRPVIIGTESHGMTGSLVVDTEGCVDLRDQLSLMETTVLLHKCRVLLTNDSSPLHMAASSPGAHVGFISTVKHPDLITHWRFNDIGKVEFGWRMQNFSKGGKWQEMDMCPTSPTKGFDVRLDHVGQEKLHSWLPDSKQYAEWAIEKCRHI